MAERHLTKSKVVRKAQSVMNRSRALVQVRRSIAWRLERYLDQHNGAADVLKDGLNQESLDLIREFTEIKPIVAETLRRSRRLTKQVREAHRRLRSTTEQARSSLEQAKRMSLKRAGCVDVATLNASNLW